MAVRPLGRFGVRASDFFRISGFGRRISDFREIAAKSLLTSPVCLLVSPLPLIGILMKTHLPKVNLDERKWHVIDASGVVLGRLAVQVADILRGKDKPVFTPHLDAGDFVVVINAEKVRVTGKKEDAKQYMTYSGWKGGERYTSVAQLRARHPEMLIHRAVRGMIPKNRLGRVLLTKLKVYKGDKHPHSAQQPAALTPVT
jgi:large subunit ribosomal protein L13